MVKNIIYQYKIQNIYIIQTHNFEMIMANSNSLKSGNNPLKCLIIDDELVAIKIIATKYRKIKIFLSLKITCSSAIEAADILKEKRLI